MNKERIINILSDIKKYLSDLEKIKIKNLNDLKDINKYYAVSMILFSLLNRVIDLGQEIIISKNYGMPSTYKEIFKILCDRKIINDKMFLEFEKLVNLRNSLSHEYYRIDEKDIYNGLIKVNLIKQFVEVAKKEVK